MLIDKFDGIKTFNLIAPEEEYVNLIPKGDRVIHIPGILTVSSSEIIGSHLLGSFVDRDNNLWTAGIQAAPDGQFCPCIKKWKYLPDTDNYDSALTWGYCALSGHGASTFEVPVKFIQSSAPSGIIYVLASWRRTTSGTRIYTRVFMIDPYATSAPNALLPSIALPGELTDPQITTSLTYYDNRLYVLDIVQHIIAASQVDPGVSPSWDYQVYSSDVSAISQAIIAFGGILYYFTNRNVQPWTRTGQLNEPIQLNTTTINPMGGMQPININGELYYIGFDNSGHQSIMKITGQHAVQKVSNKQVENIAQNTFYQIQQFVWHEDVYIACYHHNKERPAGASGGIVYDYKQALMMDALTGIWFSWDSSEQKITDINPRQLYSIRHNAVLTFYNNRIQIGYNQPDANQPIYDIPIYMTLSLKLPFTLRNIINRLCIKASMFEYDVDQRAIILKMLFGIDGGGRQESYQLTATPYQQWGVDELVFEKRKLGSTNAVKLQLLFYDPSGTLPDYMFRKIQLTQIEIT